MKLYKSIIVLMLCAAPAFSGRGTKARQLLTVEEDKKIILKQSWEHLTKDGNTLGDVINEFYNELKQTDPHIESLFQFRNSIQIGERFGRMLGLIYKSLDNPREVLPQFEYLGFFHAKLNIQKSHYFQFANILSTKFAAKYCELMQIEKEHPSYTETYTNVWTAWEELINKAGKVLLLYQDGGLKGIEEPLYVKSRFANKPKFTFNNNGIVIQAGNTKEEIPFSQINSTALQTETNSITITFNYYQQNNRIIQTPDRILRFQNNGAAERIEKKINRFFDLHERAQILYQNENR